MSEEKRELLYPTEFVELPSKGMFYPETSPLRSGQIELKYVTAKEEDILTSTTLIQKGTVLDVFFNSLIVTKGVKTTDLLLGDVNAVIVASRILGYGKDFPINTTCPKCKKSIEQIVDVSLLNTINDPTPTTKSTKEIVLPVSGHKIVLKLLTHGDELEIEKTVKGYKKVNAEVSTESTVKLAFMIQSFNGEDNFLKILSLVQNLLVKDSKFIREQYREFEPNVDFTFTVDCDCSDEPGTMRLPIGPSFFWTNS